MQVSELTTIMKTGDLKKLFLKNSDPDTLAFINSGILELYKKFPLWRDSVDITPVAGTKDYKFNGEDPNVPLNLDDAQLMLIEEVTATDIEDEEFTFVPTNSTRPKNFSTPVYNVLRIHSDYEPYSLSVEVRLAPVSLTRTNDDIPLPPQLIEPLLLYAAYKAHSSVSANVKDENNTYYIRFTKSISDIVLSGQYPLDPLDVSLLAARGFL